MRLRLATVPFQMVTATVCLIPLITTCFSLFWLVMNSMPTCVGTSKTSESRHAEWQSGGEGGGVQEGALATRIMLKLRSPATWEMVGKASPTFGICACSVIGNSSSIGQTWGLP